MLTPMMVSRDDTDCTASENCGCNPKIIHKTVTLGELLDAGLNVNSEFPDDDARKTLVVIVQEHWTRHKFDDDLGDFIYNEIEFEDYACDAFVRCWVYGEIIWDSIVRNNKIGSRRVNARIMSENIRAIISLIK